MDLFLGFDGGGTRTRAWLVDQTGRRLGTGQAGPANPNNVGTAGAVAAIAAAANEARRAAGLEGKPVRAAFAACAGLKTAGDSAAFALALTSAGVASEVQAANDTEAALAGGLAGAPGIALIAGTGSFCLGRDASGRRAWRGGWGWLLDDIGGAFWIGREAVRAVALAADGRAPATRLREPVLAHFKVGEPDALLGALYRPDLSPVELAALAPLVDAAALAGDEPAKAILEASAHGSAELVRLVAGALQWNGSVPLVIIGGLGRSGPPYTPVLHAAIAAVAPAVRFVDPLLPPVAGAVLRALEMGGVSSSPTLIETLSSSV